jgi:hypothetical protein
LGSATTAAGTSHVPSSSEPHDRKVLELHQIMLLKLTDERRLWQRRSDGG